MVDHVKNKVAKEGEQQYLTLTLNNVLPPSNKRVYGYRKMRDDLDKVIIYQLKIDDYLGLSSGSHKKEECEKVRNELIEMTKSYYTESKLAYET